MWHCSDDYLQAAPEAFGELAEHCISGEDACDEVIGVQDQDALPTLPQVSSPSLSAGPAGPTLVPSFAINAAPPVNAIVDELEGKGQERLPAQKRRKKAKEEGKYA